MKGRRFFALGFVLALAVLGLLSHRARAESPGVWYVSRDGPSTGADGRTWGTAWNELNRVNWSSVQAGDLIFVDGGPTACPPIGDEPPGCGMVYNTLLALGKDGVTVQLAPDPGRNGTVIQDGNQTRFTYCAENVGMPSPPSRPGSTTVLEQAMTFNGRKGATLDGTKWGGWSIRNARRFGVNLGGGGSNTVKYARIHHINDPSDTTNSSVGITQGWTATGDRVERVEIYRNGQDAIRVAGDGFTLRQSYIHDLYCNHPDGVQAFVATSNADVPDGEGLINGLSVEDSLFERIGLQAVFLGENDSHNSWVENAVIRGNLFGPGTYTIKSKHGRSRNWLIEFNTVLGSSQFTLEWCCASPGAAAPMVVRNNVFVRTRNPAGTGFFFSTGGGTTTFAHNCVYLGGGRTGQRTETGTITSNPLFESATNFLLQPTSPCIGRGSALGGLSGLLSVLPDVEPSPTASPSLGPPDDTATPSETPSPSPTHTETATATPTETPTPTPTPTGTAVIVRDPGTGCYVLYVNGMPVGIDGCPEP